MFNVRLTGGHLYGKQLFTWLSLVVSLMVLWNLKKNLPKYFELFILFLNMSNVCCRVKYVALEILCFPC